MESIVERLRNYDECTDADIDEAADMLEFFFGQMAVYSADMGGKHRYRLRGSGWPMTHYIGPNSEAAVRNAIAEVRRERQNSTEKV